MVQSLKAKFLFIGLATTGLIGAGVGRGVIKLSNYDVFIFFFVTGFFALMINLLAIVCSLIFICLDYQEVVSFLPAPESIDIYLNPEILMCSSVVHYSNAESITTQSQIKLNLASGGKKLNPWLLTGFVDAEGSFSLSIRFNDKYSSK
jgi:hypothetical protein